VHPLHCSKRSCSKTLRWHSHGTLGTASIPAFVDIADASGRVACLDAVNAVDSGRSICVLGADIGSFESG
jgi:hypothetical protein